MDDATYYSDTRTARSTFQSACLATITIMQALSQLSSAEMLRPQSVHLLPDNADLTRLLIEAFQEQVKASENQGRGVAEILDAEDYQ